jgi:uncharacterized SAM-binding protein YcdF (DUF218 family)
LHYDAAGFLAMPTSSSKALREDAGRRMPPSRALKPRRIVLFIVGLLVIVTILVAAGFVWFIQRLPTAEAMLDRNADGIVVLTGRASRISDAIELLSRNRGKRLLITGVFPTTTAAAISRLVPEHQKLVNERVDLDHSAVNTVGNAIQTRNWAKLNNFRSLIVVTSNYHMPRAMVELAHQLPEVELIAFSIQPEKAPTEDWWSNLATMKMLFAEYLKYLRAVVRTQTSYVLIRPNKL